MLCLLGLSGDRLLVLVVDIVVVEVVRVVAIAIVVVDRPPLLQKLLTSFANTSTTFLNNCAFILCCGLSIKAKQIFSHTMVLNDIVGLASLYRRTSWTHMSVCCWCVPSELLATWLLTANA